jgi:hypothetical protein
MCFTNSNPFVDVAMKLLPGFIVLLVKHGEVSPSSSLGFPSLRMIVADQLCCRCIRNDLLWVFAAWNNGCNRVMLQAPSQCPLGHIHAFWHFVLLNALNLFEFLFNAFGIVTMTNVRVTEYSTWLVFTA